MYTLIKSERTHAHFSLVPERFVTPRICPQPCRTRLCHAMPYPTLPHQVSLLKLQISRNPPKASTLYRFIREQKSSIYLIAMVPSPRFCRVCGERGEWM